MRGYRGVIGDPTRTSTDVIQRDRSETRARGPRRIDQHVDLHVQRHGQHRARPEKSRQTIGDFDLEQSCKSRPRRFPLIKRPRGGEKKRLLNRDSGIPRHRSNTNV